MTAVCWVPCKTNYAVSMSVDYFLCVEQAGNRGCSWTSHPFESVLSNHSLLLLFPVSLLMYKKLKGREGKQSQPIFICCLAPFLDPLFQEYLGKQAQKLFLQFLMKEMEEINWNRGTAMM